MDPSAFEVTAKKEDQIWKTAAYGDKESKDEILKTSDRTDFN